MGLVAQAGYSYPQLAPHRLSAEVSSAVYDPVTNRMIVFGGAAILSVPLHFHHYNDVWILTNANGLGGTPEWIQLAPIGALPASELLFSIAYDPISNRMTLFGGYIRWYYAR